MLKTTIKIGSIITIRKVVMRSIVEERTILTKIRKGISIKMISMRKVNSRSMEEMPISTKRKTTNIMMMKDITKGTQEIMAEIISKAIKTILKHPIQIIQAFQMRILLKTFPSLVQVNISHKKNSLIFSHGKVNKCTKMRISIITTWKTKMK